MAFDLKHIQQQQAKTPSKGVDLSFLQKEVIVFKKPFSNKIKESFYVELGVLLHAGINLKEAIELISSGVKNKKTKVIIDEQLNQIINGLSFSETMKNQPCFNDYEYYSVKIGEETGSLAKIAIQLGEFYARKNEQKRQLINALTYPIIILSTAILVVLFMLRYVVPMFEDIFKQQNVNLPAITQFIVSLSSFTKSFGWLLVLISIIAIIAFRFLRNKPRFRKYKSIVLDKIPVVGRFIKTIYLAQFAQAVSLLSASKVPFVDSLKMVRKMIQYYPLQQALDKAVESLLKGSSLSESMSDSPMFDHKMLALIKVAEETNKTEYVFERLNMQYNSQVQQQSKLLSTILEPVIILIVGIFVGIILIAMYLPMFKLSSVLG